jgi:hypothetical protein
MRLIEMLYEARARGDRATVQAILSPDIMWHDPYPPPHGGDLRGAEAVFRDIFDRAGELTGGSTRLWLEGVLATDRHVVALVDWSSTFRARRCKAESSRCTKSKVAESLRHGFIPRIQRRCAHSLSEYGVKRSIRR